MASLKEMRNRIGSVKATQKITKAMQMVAAAKLKRAQDQAESARPYAARMAAVIANLARGVSGGGAPRLLAGTGSDQKHLIVVATADKGLAGGFNSSIVRAARERIASLLAKPRPISAAPPMSTSPLKRPSSRRSCRATSRSRCWRPSTRTRPASSEPRWAPWTPPPATPAT